MTLLSQAGVNMLITLRLEVWGYKTNQESCLNMPLSEKIANCELD